jgi:hypothetical protein
MVGSSLQVQCIMCCLLLLCTPQITPFIYFTRAIFSRKIDFGFGNQCITFFQLVLHFQSISSAVPCSILSYFYMADGLYFTSLHTCGRYPYQCSDMFRWRRRLEWFTVCLMMCHLFSFLGCAMAQIDSCWPLNHRRQSVWYLWWTQWN